MNNLLWLAPKLRGNPRFYASPLFALLTTKTQGLFEQKRTIVLFHYTGSSGGPSLIRRHLADTLCTANGTSPQNQQLHSEPWVCKVCKALPAGGRHGGQEFGVKRLRIQSPKSDYAPSAVDVGQTAACVEMIDSNGGISP